MNVHAPLNSYDVGGVRLSQPFKIRRLGHTGIDVLSYDKTVDFYTQTLGFRATDSNDLRTMPGFEKAAEGLEDGRFTFLNYGSDHHALVVVARPCARRLLGEAAPGITLNQITWQVNALSEVVAGAEYVAQRGSEVVRGGRDMPGSNWAVYFKAPDDHVNELYYGIEQIGWNRKSKPQSMYVNGFHGPISLPQRPERVEVDEAISQGIDIDSGFQTPAPRSPTYSVGGVLLERPFKIVRLGPLRFFVPDVGEMTAFYRDVLGLTVTEEVVFEGMRCVFLRAGSEHHSIALYPLALRDRLGFSKHSQCMSLGFQVGDYRQLRDSIQYLKQKGCKIIDFPAELHPGTDYTVNVLDPEGHCVQLYYYMEQIGWDGLPRPAHLRRRGNGEWPEFIDPVSDIFSDSPFQGPLD
jgi:catechol 2,3-dioxygenase-like lactoylglutathione lyase family enzyme